ENQLAFIHFLRLIADGEVGPEEAVKAYHGVLERLGVKPQRSLEDDMVLQTNVMNYGGTGVTVSLPPKEAGCTCACPCKAEGNTPARSASEVTQPDAVDFSKMTAAQKIAYHKARWDRVLG